VAFALAEMAAQPNHRSPLTTRRFSFCSSATTMPMERPLSGSVSMPVS
jgi:hypothetical protein